MAKTGRYIALFIIIITMLLHPKNSNAQSLTGTSGLITIPTAEILEDRQVSFGSSLLNKKYLDYGNNEYHIIASFVTLGYLPFLEVSLRLTNLLDLPHSQALGDRMVSVRLRPFRESRFLPSLVLGAHDFISPGKPSNFFNSLYLSTSKSLPSYPLIGSIRLHLGYGTDWLNAKDYQFTGVFGGISISPKPYIAFILEHDAENVNCGIRISILSHIELLAALSGLNALSGGVIYKFIL